MNQNSTPISLFGPSESLSGIEAAWCFPLQALTCSCLVFSKVILLKMEHLETMLSSAQLRDLYLRTRTNEQLLHGILGREDFVMRGIPHKCARRYFVCLMRAQPFLLFSPSIKPPHPPPPPQIKKYSQDTITYHHG